jgi:hypothetical protein
MIMMWALIMVSSSPSLIVSAYSGVSSSCWSSSTMTGGRRLLLSRRIRRSCVLWAEPSRTSTRTNSSSSTTRTTQTRHENHDHPCSTTPTRTTKTTTATTLFGVRNKNENESSFSSSSSTSSSMLILNNVGLIAQPIVWISLVCVSTTGGGLPEGPYGLVGAIEGLSYLAVVGWAAVALWNQYRRRVVVGSSSSSTTTTTTTTATPPPQTPPPPLSERLSLFTIGIGLVVLVQLVTDQGCIPNAKPILDYSAYVNVCNS